jgi:hypothetical protein
MICSSVLALGNFNAKIMSPFVYIMCSHSIALFLAIGKALEYDRNFKGPIRAKARYYKHAKFLL